MNQIYIRNKEPISLWKPCTDFKKVIESNGYVYTNELEDSLLERLKNEGELTLMWHILKNTNFHSPLITKKVGKIIVVFQKQEKKVALSKMECYKHKQFGANARVKELAHLGVTCYSNTKKISDVPQNESVSIVTHSNDNKFLNGVFFFKHESNALFKLEKLLKNHPDAGIVMLDYLTNVTKEEQKNGVTR